MYTTSIGFSHEISAIKGPSELFPIPPSPPVPVPATRRHVGVADDGHAVGRRHDLVELGQLAVAAALRCQVYDHLAPVRGERESLNQRNWRKKWGIPVWNDGTMEPTKVRLPCNISLVGE